MGNRKKLYINMTCPVCECMTWYRDDSIDSEGEFICAGCGEHVFPEDMSAVASNTFNGSGTEPEKKGKRKLLMSFNQESNDISVVKTVDADKAADALYSYMKERIMDLNEDVTEEEAEAILEAGRNEEYGVDYRKYTGCASIFLDDGAYEHVQILDVPEELSTSRHYEDRKTDVEKRLLEMIKMDHPDDVRQEELSAIAEAAADRFEELINFPPEGYLSEAYWQFIDTAINETLRQPCCRYCIFQLKDSESEYLFEPYKWLEKKGKVPRITDYDPVYSDESIGRTDMEVLRRLWVKFNVDHPDDFKGHSLSVSDVIGIRRAENERFYYVDSYGYVELQDFTAVPVE